MNRLKLVGLVGELNTGKGTVAQAFRNAGYIEMAFADPLKRIVRDLFDVPTTVLWGPSENRTPVVRQMLQELGTDYARKFRPNIWVEKMQEALKNLDATDTNHLGVVISDVRFPNEAAMIRDMGGYLVRIKRPGNSSHLPENLAAHTSETALATLPDNIYDAVLYNDGSLDDFNTTITQLLTDCEKQ